MSYFPYFTVSPNDGLMGLGRIVFFRQSRWDDRVSLTDEVAIEGGYSTKDAWLARVKGDFPRIAPGWRLQVLGEAARTPELAADGSEGFRANREVAGVDITRRVAGPLLLALRGDAVHLDGSFLPRDFYSSHYDHEYTWTETDTRVRAAVVLDLRDREYDTRSGALLQTGVYLGNSRDRDFGQDLGNTSYHGWYALGAAWIPMSDRDRATIRLGARALSASPIDPSRILPAWEDEFVVLGGPESNRGLPSGQLDGRGLLLSSVEVRHDLVRFPAAAIAVLAFVDAGRLFRDDCDTVASAALRSGFFCDHGALRLDFKHWVVAPGGGIAIRLLRNAVLTSTVGFAEGKARFYVSSGWSW